MLTLIGCALAFVVVLLDVSVVNVALDALRASFSTDVTGLAWVVNVYTVVLAALLLLAGALGDRLGARKVMLAGFVLFTLASLACGLAPTLAALLTGRALQGAAAALLVPNSLALLQQAFPLPQARSRAVAWWAAAGGVALALGPLAGGFLVEHSGWRSIFLVNLPIGLAGLVLTWRHAAPGPADPRRALDLPGQALAATTLASLALALMNAGRLGWLHPATALCALLAIAAALAFVAVEARSAVPLVPLALFASRPFAAVSISGALLNFAYYGSLFVFSLFFQEQRQFSPQETGFAFLPMTVVLMAGSIAGGRLVTRLGARRLMVFGQAASATGYLLLFAALDTGSYVLLVGPMLMAAGGMALTVPTMTNVTLSSVAPSHVGLASGVFNTARQLGGMLGVAVCGDLVRGMGSAAFMAGMRASLVLAVILLLGGALLCFFRLGSPSDATAPRACTSRTG